MTLHLAKSLFMNDRLDANRPQLNWVARAFYSGRRLRF
jgi:hypothetical protein